MGREISLWVRGVKAGLISMPIYAAALWILALTAASIHGFDLSESMVDVLGLYRVPVASLQGFLSTVIERALGLTKHLKSTRGIYS